MKGKFLIKTENQKFKMDNIKTCLMLLRQLDKLKKNYTCDYFNEELNLFMKVIFK